MIVPLLEELLHWSEFETSLFFCGAGIEVSTIISNVCINLQTILCIKAHRFIYSVNTTKQEDI